MGLLDDAIREHLDLKRRRGADPTDVERAEREALGPVRREAFEEADDEPRVAAELDHQLEDEPVEHDDELHPHEENGDWGELFEEDEPHHAVEPNHAEEPHAEEPVRAEPAPHPAPTPAPGPAEPEPEPFDHEEPWGEPEPPAAGDETIEYDVEQELANERRSSHPEPQPERDDVLEETPEFLQDAPDHDRLWFEQRPPRDFDFDG